MASGVDRGASRHVQVGAVGVHILQTLPASNVNRDNSGSPKTATYGGVRRARVSSQSWKRAVRLA
ncbi:type I-E CRISPR-associated protein Cas7/Cse4/CasC, partial [Micromonospora sp. MH33]|uniref:type I-E CRISPR-associated protein Cas7/Cse4/CasC n=1 Tax=Micromonospora sp. MH33 TaxID=1945509 RepID=UPI001FEFC6CD